MGNNQSKTIHAYIWGIGKYYEKLRKAIKSECVVDGLLDSSPCFVSISDGDRVKKPEILKTVEFDYVIVTVENPRAIIEMYKDYNLPIEKLICLWEMEDTNYDFIDYNIVGLVKREYYQKKYKLRLENIPFEYGAPNSISIVDAKILLKEILTFRKSLARFGDGEFEIMRMRTRPWFQEPVSELSTRLQEIAKAELASLCIAVADNYGNLEKYTEQAADAIREYIVPNNTRIETLKFLSPHKIYYDAYVTRPYIIYRDKSRAKDIFLLWKSIWDYRDVLLVEGKTSRMGMGNDLLSNAKSVRRILCPERNAFSVYENILEKIHFYAKKDDLILIKLGPTATVLAYDLAKSRYQAIDIGQLDNEYDWWQMQVDRRVAIQGKTVSEVFVGRFPCAVNDKEIEKEILCCIE